MFCNILFLDFFFAFEEFWYLEVIDVDKKKRRRSFLSHEDFFCRTNKSESHRKIGAGYAIKGQATLTVWLSCTRTPRTLNSSATLIFGRILPIGSINRKYKSCVEYLLVYFAQSNDFPIKININISSGDSLNVGINWVCAVF